jgi:hypothetical protein
VGGTSLGENFRGIYEEQMVTAAPEANDDTYGFRLAGESQGDDWDDLGQFANFLPVLPIEIPGELR